MPDWEFQVEAVDCVGSSLTFEDFSRGIHDHLCLKIEIMCATLHDQNLIKSWGSHLMLNQIIIRLLVQVPPRDLRMCVHHCRLHWIQIDIIFFFCVPAHWPMTRPYLSVWLIFWTPEHVTIIDGSWWCSCSHLTSGSFGLWKWDKSHKIVTIAWLVRNFYNPSMGP